MSNEPTIKDTTDSRTISREEIEPLYRQVAAELKARRISRQTLDSALAFIGKVLPALSGFESAAQIAILGIACYNAGVKSEQAKQGAERKKLREKLATDPAEAYRQGAKNYIESTKGTDACKAQRDLCFSVWKHWKAGDWPDEAEQGAE